MQPSPMEIWLLVGGVGLLLFSLLMLVLGIALVVYSKKKERPAAGVVPHVQAVPPPPPPAPSPRPVPTPLPPAASTAPSPSWGSLTGTSGVVIGRTIPVDANGFYIGRDVAAAQVVVESPRVSKRHLWVGVLNGAVVAVDQNSTNGTYLNTLSSPRITEVPLQPGDTLILADDAARFEYQR
jgi:hypothetical protein